MACETPQIFNGKEVPGCNGKCKFCRSIARWKVSARIACETAASPKNWFVTLTLRRSMSDAVGYLLVQRWLKRLRKRLGKKSASKLRYACVAEHGGSATKRLHYHLVVHGPTSLTERDIRKTWRGGFSEATLVASGDAPRVARYSSKVANYVGKGSRFRFSQAYGSQALGLIAGRTNLVEAMDALYSLGPVRVRIGGINIPSRMLPDIPFRSRFDPDLLADLAGLNRGF